MNHKRGCSNGPLENLITRVWDLKILHVAGADLTVGTIVWTLGMLTGCSWVSPGYVAQQ